MYKLQSYCQALWKLWLSCSLAVLKDTCYNVPYPKQNMLCAVQFSDITRITLSTQQQCSEESGQNILLTEGLKIFNQSGTSMDLHFFLVRCPWATKQCKWGLLKLTMFKCIVYTWKTQTLSRFLSAVFKSAMIRLVHIQGKHLPRYTFQLRDDRLHGRLYRRSAKTAEMGFMWFEWVCHYAK